MVMLYGVCITLIEHFHSFYLSLSLNNFAYQRGMFMFFQPYLDEIKQLKFYIIGLALIIFLSYAVYLVLDQDASIKIGSEDGLFEWLTSINFAVASVLYFFCFKKSKNLMFIVLSFILFFGAGEEINWGQRIFRFETPQELKAVNVQQDFNIHNIEVFNGIDLQGEHKSGLKRLLEIDFIFRVGSIVFFVCIPFLAHYIKLPLGFNIGANRKLEIPLVPFTIGIFFFISWLSFYCLKTFILPSEIAAAPKIDFSLNETFECTAAFVYFVVAVYFYNAKYDVVEQ